MIKQYSLNVLQSALNHALGLDKATVQKIRQLQGKVLQLVITPLNVQFYLVFTEDALRLLAKYDGLPDTIIYSSPLGLIRLSLLPSSKARSLFNDKIRISGDVELGQQVKQLFDELDVDWEGHLARFTGDVVAHQLGSFVRQGLDFKNQLSESLRQNASEYVHEELRLCPSQEELNDFYNEIDALVLQTDRLTAHVNQLLADYEFN
jgi:ubiquinone biosynthesis protein UbiJ